MDTTDLRAARRARLNWLRSEKYPNDQQQQFAERIGSQPSMLGQWLSGHRGISEGTARRIESKLRYPKGWLDGEQPKVTEPDLSPMAKRLGREFDKIDASRQNAVFVELMDHIERLSTPPAPEEDSLDRRPNTRRRKKTEKPDGPSPAP